MLTLSSFTRGVDMVVMACLLHNTHTHELSASYIHMMFMQVQCQQCMQVRTYVCMQLSSNKYSTIQTTLYLAETNEYLNTNITVHLSPNICDWAYENQPRQHKNHKFVLPLLYHNLQTICIKPLSLLQNLMGFLMKLTEMEYCIQSWRYQQKYNSV